MEEAAQAAETPVAQTDFVVPEAYSGKPWVEKIKSPDDLWRTLDGAQSSLGRRPAGIPQDDAPAEEWEKFYSSVRPDSPQKYALPDVEGVPEGVDVSGYKAIAAEIAHKVGLTQKQASDLWREYISTEIKAADKHKASAAEQQKALDAEFEALAKEHLGDVGEAAKLTRSQVERYVPEGLRPMMDQIVDNPKLLTFVASMAKGMNSEIAKLRKEYGVEGDPIKGGGAADTGGEDINAVRQKLAALRVSTAAKDPFSPEYKQTLEEIRNLSAKVDSFYNKK